MYPYVLIVCYFYSRFFQFLYMVFPVDIGFNEHGVTCKIIYICV